MPSRLQILFPFLVFLFMGQASYAQVPALNFFRTIGVYQPSVAGEWDFGSSVDYDQSGNMLVAGNTRGGSIYVQNADSLTQMSTSSNMNHTVFVYKYDPLGSIDFAFTIQNGYLPQVYSLADGSFYLAYRLIHDSVDANPNPSQNMWITRNQNGGTQVISRFDINGNLLWAFGLNLPFHTAITDKSDNLIIGSKNQLNITVNLNPLGAAQYVSSATGILSKYNKNGQLVWSRDSVHVIRPNGLSQSHYNERIAVNSKNEIILACDLTANENVIDVNPLGGIDNFLKRDSGEIVVATYDSNGYFKRAFNFGQDLGAASAYKENRAYVIRVDGNDNLYINGSNANGDFDPDSTKIYQIAPNPVWALQYTDGFLASYTSNGKLRWVNPIRLNYYGPIYKLGDLSRNLGISTYGYYGSPFELDNNGNQYMIYYVRSQYDLDPGLDSVIVQAASVNLQSTVLGQIVLAQYDSNGTYVDHTTIYDTLLNHSDYFSDIAIDDNCNLFITGIVGRHKTFTTIPVFSSGNYLQHSIINGTSLESDAVAMRYDLSDIPMPYLVKSKSKLEVCQGESGKIFVGSKGLVEWYDSSTNGNLLGTGHEFQFPPLYANKTYYVQSVICNSNSSRLPVSINVTNIDSTISIQSDTLWANETNAIYQWIDCNTNLHIPGATNRYCNFPGPGNYAVQITKGNCTITSQCILIAPQNIQNIENTQYTIYPNPAQNSLFISSDHSNTTSYLLFDAQGNKLSAGQFIKKTVLDISYLSKGIYFIRIAEKGLISFVKE